MLRQIVCRSGSSRRYHSHSRETRSWFDLHAHASPVNQIFRPGILLVLHVGLQTSKPTLSASYPQTSHNHRLHLQNLGQNLQACHANGMNSNR